MTPQERAQAYLGFLADEGFRPVVDEDGDVVFKVEGYMYYISIDEDEQFFRLIFPNFWPIETELQRAESEAAALRVTGRMKVVKILPAERGVLASVEMFCDPPDVVFPVLLRSIQAIQGAVRAFFEEMRGTA